jgi:predicted MFS family arabinose efflux permease
MCAIPIFNNMNTKFVLTLCLLANAASLFIFTVSSAFEVYLLSRFLVGFF